jgi:hypothetical protein
MGGTCVTSVTRVTLESRDAPQASPLGLGLGGVLDRSAAADPASVLLEHGSELSGAREALLGGAGNELGQGVP